MVVSWQCSVHFYEGTSLTGYTWKNEWIWILEAMGVFAIRELNIPPSLADINSEDSLVFGFIYYLTITKRGHLCATCNVYFGRRHLQMFTNIYSSSKYSFTVVRYHYSADIRDSCDWRYKPSMLYSIGDISWNTLYSLPFWSNLAPAFKLHGVFQWCGGAIALIILVILILFECFIHTYQQAHATNAVWLTKKSPVSALRCSRACQFIVI